MRNLFFLIAALGLAALAALLVRGQFGADPPPPPQVQQPERPEPPKVATVEVLVAERAVEPGRFLDPDSLAWMPWPKAAVADTFIRRGDADRAAFADTVARQPIAAGQPLVSGQLVRPGQRGFLAAVLRPGTRAVSISMDAAAAVSGLVYPGDRVDVLLTYAAPPSAAAGGPGPGGGTPSAGRMNQATRTVLTGLRVVAVGQRLAPAEPGDRPGLDARTITLQATPVQARQIALARDLGGITLALHSLTTPAGPDGAGDSDMARAGDLLATGGALPPEQGMRHTIRVIEGTQEREVEVDAQ